MEKQQNKMFTFNVARYNKLQETIYALEYMLIQVQSKNKVYFI